MNTTAPHVTTEYRVDLPVFSFSSPGLYQPDLDRLLNRMTLSMRLRDEDGTRVVREVRAMCPRIRHSIQPIPTIADQLAKSASLAHSKETASCHSRHPPRLLAMHVIKTQLGRLLFPRVP